MSTGTPWYGRCDPSLECSLDSSAQPWLRLDHFRLQAHRCGERGRNQACFFALFHDPQRLRAVGSVRHGYPGTQHDLGEAGHALLAIEHAVRGKFEPFELELRELR